MKMIPKAKSHSSLKLGQQHILKTDNKVKE